MDSGTVLQVIAFLQLAEMEGKILFSSDSTTEDQVLSFNGANQSPQTKSSRDIYIKDLKVPNLENEGSPLEIDILYHLQIQ